MAKTIIFDPQIRLNNTTIAKVGNTATLDTGDPESMNSPQTSGNGEVEMVYSEDITTKYSTFKFSLYSTVENIDLVSEVKKDRNNNYITINSEQGNYVLKDAALINKPEFALENEGMAELEFHCKPVE